MANKKGAAKEQKTKEQGTITWVFLKTRKQIQDCEAIPKVLRDFLQIVETAKFAYIDEGNRFLIVDVIKVDDGKEEKGCAVFDFNDFKKTKKLDVNKDEFEFQPGWITAKKYVENLLAQEAK